MLRLGRDNREPGDVRDIHGVSRRKPLGFAVGLAMPIGGWGTIRIRHATPEERQGIVRQLGWSDDLAVGYWFNSRTAATRDRMAVRVHFEQSVTRE